MVRHLAPAYLAGAFFFIGLLPAAHAQAPVESLTNAPAARTQLVLQIQALQEDLRTMRGQIEQLEHQIHRLEQTQRDNYADLDKRLQQHPPGTATPPPAPAQPNPATDANSPAAALYQRGFTALLADDTESALEAFDALTEQHPNAAEVPDALYWLGESHWLANRREPARRAFVQMLQTAPQHRRAGDAMYRLGTLYAALDEPAQAQDYMQQAAQTRSPRAADAQRWLDQQNPPPAESDPPTTKPDTPENPTAPTDG